MKKLPWGQIVFLCLYIPAHYICSMFYSFAGSEPPAPLADIIRGEIGFTLYFFNLPFTFLAKYANYQIQSVLSAVLYSLLFLYAYRLATKD